MMTLRPYQLEAVKEILEKKKIIVADDMSLGKCAESITPKNIVEKRQGYDSQTLIVCPGPVAYHWEREIRLWYRKKEDTQVSIVHTQTFKSDVRRAENADFVIIGYSTLSKASPEMIASLKGFNFQYGILDEAQNAKNPNSLRSRAVKEIFDGLDYLVITSGTPIPNTLIDIYMLLSLLDKEQFPINPENSRAVLEEFYSLFRRDPEFVRRILSERMIRRKVDDYLQSRFPRLNQSSIDVVLDGDHAEVYKQVYQNDEVMPSTKLIQLIKASIDPNLVKPELLDPKLASKIGKMDSSVYLALDDLISRIVNSDGKAIIFTNLRTRVTDKLQERYNRYGAVVIDGNVRSRNDNGYSLREDLRQRFQHDSDCRVMISTTVMDEGVDLTGATSIIHLTLPYTPASFDQRNRRSQRIGEISKEEVDSYVIRPRLGRIPMITDGIQNLIDDKRRVITYLIEQPNFLTKEDLDEIKGVKAHKSRHLVPLINAPQEAIRLHMGKLKCQGFNKILDFYNKYPEQARFIAQVYTDYWEGFYAGNTARLYARVIQLLEEKEILERKLDIASGPFSLSRVIGQPVTNLDINESMLDAGRILEKEGRVVKGNKVVRATYHLLPFEDCSFDLTLCSLALHTSRRKIRVNGEVIMEREQALRETNRVLRQGGIGLITLPHSTILENDQPNFYTALRQLGFDVLPFSGFYKGPESTKFKVYIAGVKKIAEPSQEPINNDLLELQVDRRKDKSGGLRSSKEKKKQLIPEKKEIKKEFITQFHNTRNGKTIEEIIKTII